MRFAPRNFNDLLALILVTFTFGLWVYLVTQVVAGRVAVEAVAIIVTATITTLGQVVTFYFRKKPEDSTNNGG